MSLAVMCLAVVCLGSQHGTTQQGAAGVVDAAWIADHPTVLPPASIFGLTLRLDHQLHPMELVTAGAQLIAMAPLEHQITVPFDLKPASRLRHLIKGQAM